MRLAVIDCGTNTFNLLVVELGPSLIYSKIFHSRVPVKLGEGSVNAGFISDRPFRRGMEAIESFSTRIAELRVDKVLAFATSAIRDGENGMEFVRLAKDRFGIIIDIIDGDREAGLIYLGIREAVKLQDEVSLIMDIGGGSIEFLFVNREKVFWKHSFNLGAARLLEKFNPSDRITETEVQKINEFLREKLSTLFEAAAIHKPVELVGSSGAFESFVEMMHGAFGSEGLSSGLTEYSLPLESYFKIAEKVIGSTLAERKLIKGLVPMRVDMIVICCLMVNFILSEMKLTKMRISTHSLKEGALVEYINKNVKK